MASFVYVVIENEDVEVTNLRVFSTEAKARECFDRCCEEEGITPDPDVETGHELEDTLLLAVSHPYAVQLLVRNVEE